MQTIRVPPERRRRFRSLKSVPVLPSLVTLGNLFFGFLAMAKVADAVALAGRGQGVSFGSPEVVAMFEIAAMFIFVAMIFDGLDGAVARLTRQATPFGAQLDSLADVVTFGVAPAFIAKVLVDLHASGADALLPTHPKLYYVAAAIYVLCGAMRLARFNAEQGSAEVEDHKEFSGLPSPAAAAVVGALVILYCAPAGSPAAFSKWLFPPGGEEWIVAALPLALPILGLLMVSRFPYPHLIVTLARGRHTFPFLATLVITLVVAAIEWQFALVVLVLLYVLSGIGIGLYRFVRYGQMRLPADAGTEEPDDDEPRPRGDHRN